MNHFELFVAFRYLKSQKHRNLSGVSTIAIVGVAIGVAALVIALSFMNGYEREVRSSFIGAFAHAKVRAYLDRGIENHTAIMDSLKRYPEIEAMSPFIEDKGLIRSGSDQTGIIIRGVELPSATRVTRIGENITRGDLVLSKVPNRDSTRYWPGIVLGKDLAEKLNTSVGNEVTIISLAQQSGLYDLPQMMKFIVTGIIKTGFYDLDKNFAYTSLASAQTLLGYHSRVSGVELKLSDYRIADTVVARINNDLSYPLLSESWRGMNPDLFAWVQIQKWAFFLILSLIILVATFNVASTQIMISLKKTREIGILMGMGTTRRRIRRIFTYSGLIIGLFGTLLGCVLGYGICWAQQTYRLLSLPPDVYIVDWLPVVMKSRDFLIVGVVTLFIAYLASIYPAIKASQMTPVKAIRNE